MHRYRITIDLRTEVDFTTTKVAEFVGQLPNYVDNHVDGASYVNVEAERLGVATDRPHPRS